MANKRIAQWGVRMILAVGIAHSVPGKAMTSQQKDYFHACFMIAGLMYEHSNRNIDTDTIKLYATVKCDSLMKKVDEKNGWENMKNPKKQGCVDFLEDRLYGNDLKEKRKQAEDSLCILK